MKKFIAYELRDLDVDRDLPFYGDKLPEFKNVKDVLSSLKESTSSLEFKVNQEIFGKDPEKEFKELLDFWNSNAVVSFVVIYDDFGTFLVKHGGESYSYDFTSHSFVDSFMKILKQTSDIFTIDDYFDMIAVLDKENEEIKECEKKC